MSFFRKFARKQQKEFNYEEYNRKKVQEQEARRKQRAKALLLQAWQNAVQEAVPVWQLWLALHIPPVWYKRLITTLLSLIDRHANEYAKKVTEMDIAYWRKAFTMYTVAYGIRVISFILIGIFKWIHDRVLTFGVITTLTERPIEVAGKKEFRYVLVVRYFWSEICRKEITC
jgi:hypothetical protein